MCANVDEKTRGGFQFDKSLIHLLMVDIRQQMLDSLHFTPPKSDIAIQIALGEAMQEMVEILTVHFLTVVRNAGYFQRGHG